MDNNQRQILPAVAAIIFNEDRSILLQKRRDVNAWGLISGHVEFGESVEEAILREVKEETGANAEVNRLIGVYSTPETQLYQYDNRSVQYITTYFEVRLESEVDLAFSNEETKELGYFETSNLPENFAQINPNWLQDALNESFSGSIR